MIRTHGAGTIRKSQVGQTITLAGWVARRRDHGGVAVIDFRDASGWVQVVIRDEAIANMLRAEWCLKITGVVSERPAGNENANVATGEIVVRKANATELANLAQLAVEAEAEAEAETAKQIARQAVLDKLGLTADEAAALFG